MSTRYLAGLSLAIMAAGFLITWSMPDTVLIQLLQGSFEAGLVGGIADWFAVTALFRHPLGIPIPHTSLLIHNKDRIIRALISSMETDLLNKRSIEAKLRTVPLLKVLSGQLTKLLRRRTVRTAVLEHAGRLLRQLPLASMAPAVQAGAGQWLRSRDHRAAAEALHNKLQEAGLDRAAFDRMAGMAAEWVKRGETRTLLGRLAAQKLAGLKVNGFMGFAVQAFTGFFDENQLGGLLQNMLLSTIQELHHNGHPAREKLILDLRQLTRQFLTNEEQLSSLVDWAAGQLEGEGGLAFIEARLEDIRVIALEKLEQDRQKGGRIVWAGYRFLQRSLSRDPAILEEAEERLSNYLVDLVSANHFRIGQLVRENLEKMDDAELIAMLEDKLGRDLQWIRVNGAICGFLVGLGLSALQLVHF